MDEFKLLLIVLAFCFFVSFGIDTVVVNTTQASCSRFAQESGRECKFVKYHFMNADCLTKLDDGKWISAYNLRAN